MAATTDNNVVGRQLPSRVSARRSITATRTDIPPLRVSYNSMGPSPCSRQSKLRYIPPYHSYPFRTQWPFDCFLRVTRNDLFYRIGFVELPPVRFVRVFRETRLLIVSDQKRSPAIASGSMPLRLCAEIRYTGCTVSFRINICSIFLRKLFFIVSSNFMEEIDMFRVKH